MSGDPENRPVSAGTEDEEPFEDASESRSVRSLTRKFSAQAAPQAATNGGFDFGLGNKTQQNDHGVVENGGIHVGAGAASTEQKEDEEELAGSDSRPESSQRESVLSNGQLEAVNLDDDAAASKAPSTTRKTTSPVEVVPSKKMSFSGIANAMPAMPWSGNPPDSPAKSTTSTVVPQTPASPASATTPVQPRKLGGAFSWLSRTTSRENGTSPPPGPSARRNTASSITTLASNPEMMLGRLEEESHSNGTNGMTRNSLKDRFKAMRMREEAGITNMPEEGHEKAKEFAGLVNKGPAGLGVQIPGAEEATAAPLSPVPPSPAANLAPGTASGAAAGPSAMSDQPVDWDLWQFVVNEGPAAVAKTSPEELNRAIATGIPSAIRGVIWQVLAQSKNEDLEEVYRELVARGTDKDRDRQSNSSLSASSHGNGNLSVSKDTHSSASSIHSESGGASVLDKDAETAKTFAEMEKRQKSQREETAKLTKLEKTIRRDLGARTSYSKFAAAQGLQEGLFGVCKAYALFDEEVGYAQGMNFLIMPLLFNMPEEEAFCLLVRLMNQYQLRDLFTQDMPGLHMHLYQFERLLEDVEPALYCHLNRRGISPHLYATQWFLTLFAYRFPLQLVLRIYDLILSEGLSAILKFGIVLMQKNAQTLLGMTDMKQLTDYLKDRLFDVYIDSSPSAGSLLENGFFGSSSAALDKEVYRADELVRDACDVKMTPQTLSAYKTEWAEKTKAAKEREAELETLRSQNTTYANRVRRLEERLEAVDREQAELATQLVHDKVQNEELKDENESLKTQVAELKKIMEAQPAEIEEKWKAERDALIEGNQRVHEENQKVEKEMGELEEQLVRTKMQYAEVNSQHEALSRRWADLKKHVAD